MTWKSTSTLLESAIRFATGVAFAILILAVTIQVLGRTVTFIDSPVWTEELTRFSILYLAAFGVGLSFRSGDLVNVDIVSESLPGRLPWLLRLTSATATAVLAAMLIIPAWKFTSIGIMQTSPALGWRMDFIHASVLVMLVSLLLFSLLRLLDMLCGESDGRPISHDSEIP